MEQINAREIPNFFDIENSVKSDSKLDVNELLTYLKAKGTIEDKIRLLCICALCKDKELLTTLEGGFRQYMETLTGGERSQAEELLKAYQYLQSFRMTKNASDRNLTSRW